MATVGDKSIEFAMNLTEEEQTYLLNWLQQRRRDKRVEEHRTDTADYKAYVVHEEAILDGLIDKLRRR